MLYFIPVKALPEKKPKENHQEGMRVTDYLEGFSRSKVKYVTVKYDQGDYLTTKSCYDTIMKAIKRGGYNMRVRTINGSIYIEKTLK